MLLPFGIYLTLHFALYALWLRGRASGQSEAVMFLYHALPAAVVAAITVVRAALDGWAASTVAEAVLLVSLQGMYSLTFLELWSLAQRGYSLSILAEFESARADGLTPDTSRLERIGQEKQSDRLAGLSKLGLVVGRDGRFVLTPFGRGIAFMLQTLVFLANVKDPG